MESLEIQIQQDIRETVCMMVIEQRRTNELLSEIVKTNLLLIQALADEQTEQPMTDMDGNVVCQSSQEL